MRRDYGFDPGPRSEHDDRTPSGLTVDFTYDGTARPLALEVTGPRDQQESHARTEARKAARKLTRKAEKEGWGAVSVGLYGHAHAMKLVGPIAEAIRSMIAHGRARLDIDRYDVDEYMRARDSGVAEEFVRIHEVLRAAGLQMIHRLISPSNRVSLTVVWGAVGSGVIDALNKAINDNRVKLAKARGDSNRQTHLVIDAVGLRDSSALSLDARTPSLNHDVDMIWVVTDAEEVDGYRVWSVRRGDPGWRLHEDLPRTGLVNHDSVG